MIEQLIPLQSATLSDQIEACLVYLHSEIQSPNNFTFAPQAFNGIVRICRSFARSHMQNNALWSILYSIVGFAASTPRLEPWATECLLIFLEEIDQFFSFSLFFTLLQQFPLQNANVYHAFFAVLLQVLSQLPDPADSHGQVSENAFQILSHKSTKSANLSADSNDKPTACLSTLRFNGKAPRSNQKTL